MTKRSTTFIGAYVGTTIKDALQREAKSEHRTLSQQVTRILELHLADKDAERQACAGSICEQCRAGFDLLYSDEPLPHRFAGETVSGWVHRHAADESVFFEYCEAAPIHERSRMEVMANA